MRNFPWSAVKLVSFFGFGTALLIVGVLLMVPHKEKQDASAPPPPKTSESVPLGQTKTVIDKTPQKAKSIPRPKLSQPASPLAGPSQNGIGNQQTTVQSPVSQSNTGGCNQQVVGGNNNTTNCVPPARTLTELQKSAIGSGIDDVPPTIEVVVSHADSLDAQKFAEQVFKIVTPRHPLSHDGFWYGGHWKGIVVAVHGSDDAATWPAQKLAFVLDNNGLPLEKKVVEINPTQVQAGQICIFVGEQ